MIPRSRALLFVMLISLACGGAPLERAARGQEPAPAPGAGQDAAATAALVPGRLVGVDRSPWAGRQVRVVDLDGRTVALVTTDGGGRFALPPVPPRGYWVVVGSLWARIGLSSEDLAGREVVIVVTPTALAEEPPIPMADGLMPVAGRGNTAIIVLGASVLVIGVVASAGVIAREVADDMGKKVIYAPPVSPSTP